MSNSVVVFEQLEPRLLLSGSDVWGPLIDFPTWRQSGVYNDYTPEDPDGNEAAVGCTATAAAQVLQYWEYPDHIDFSHAEDNYDSEGSYGTIQIDEDAAVRDFPTFTQLDSALDQISYDLSNEEKGYISFGVGVKHGMNYGSSSGAHLSREAFLEGFDFGSAELEREFQDAEGVWTTENEQRVIDNIKAGRPVPCSIYVRTGTKLTSGHSVVIDGYRESDGEFHVNMGWGGSSDDWYDLPLIASRFNYVAVLMLDLMPETAWAQSYGGAHNRGWTPAPIPKTLPPQVTWHYSADSDYGIKDVVEGVGGSTFIALGKSGGGPHTEYVRVYDAHGTHVDTLTINQQYVNENIDNIAQPTRDEGSLYVQTDDRLLQIDLGSKQQKTLLTRTGSEILTLKVDEDGNAYCHTAAGEILKQSSWGNAGSEKSYNSGYKIFRDSAIAVDDTNDRVYVSAWDDPADKSVLMAFTKDLSLLDTYVFPEDVPFSSASANAPAVAPDGTVYVGSRTELYALEFKSGSLEEKWSTTPGGVARVDDPVTVGRNGRLYVGTWTDDTHLGIFALDDNGTSASEAWTYEFVASSDFDNSRFVYASANDALVAGFHKENGASADTHSVVCLLDEGTTYQSLWNTDYADSLSAAVIGSEQLLLWNEDRIEAYHSGAIGDPYGAGKGYQDNAAPLAASNLGSSVNPGAGSATLTWDCSDPDNHDLTYDVFLSENGLDEQGEMVPVATGISEKSVNVTGLSGGTYTWVTYATDGQAVSWSESASFTVDPPYTLDIDDNGSASAMTDGLLAIRYLFGFPGDSLVMGATGIGATRTTGAEVADHLAACVSAGVLDIDDNGSTTAMTDGLLIIRYLFGFPGDSLSMGATGAGANRATAPEIRAYLDALMPVQAGGAAGGAALAKLAIDTQVKASPVTSTEEVTGSLVAPTLTFAGSIPPPSSLTDPNPVSAKKDRTELEGQVEADALNPILAEPLFSEQLDDSASEPVVGDAKSPDAELWMLGQEAPLAQDDLLDPALRAL